MADTVHVAVRMRPLNQRELDLGAALCLKMDGPTTELIAADGSKKTFNFDFSFDSLDSAHPIHDQAFIFEKLGKQFILEKAWQGYNCTLFAYGQTGSGKSFSMTGGKSPDSRGLIPRTCEEMFNRIASQAGPTEQFEVSCQFLEIYNEKLRDLFNIKSQTEPRIREDPKKGVFVEPAIRERVSSYAEVEAKMEAGTKARVVAATKMNATSSRSHSVFTIYFKRIMVTAGSAKVKESCISLVDLAGSERQAKTGAEGQRLAEACAINTSLSALGNVISALAENSVPGAKPKFVPYRDSVLTRLLQNGLGGNSQTVMIAALSPAMDNYEETMSTLKYADRAKRIVNVAKINENPADKQLREMQELIAALQKQLQDRPAGASADPASQAEMDRLKEELDTRNKMLTDLQMTSEEQARAAEENRKKRDEALKDSGIATGEMLAMLGSSNTPYLTNLSPDPSLTNALVYLIDKPSKSVGSDPEGDVVLVGSGVLPAHCTITCDPSTNEVSIVLADDGAKVFINGVPVAPGAPTRLGQGDRVVVGRHLVFRFVNPALPPSPVMDPEAEWELVTKELAVARGHISSLEEYDGAFRQNAAAFHCDDLVDEANEIARALGDALQAHYLFATDLDEQKNPAVVAISLDDGISSRWSVAQLEARMEGMREMLRDFQEDGDIDWYPEENPFFEQPQDQLVGSGTLPLAPLLQSVQPCEQVVSLVTPGPHPVRIADLRVKVALRINGAPRRGPAQLTPAALLGQAVDVISEFQFLTRIPTSLSGGVYIGYQLFPGRDDKTARLMDPAVALEQHVFADPFEFRPFTEEVFNHWAHEGSMIINAFGHSRALSRASLNNELEMTRLELSAAKEALQQRAKEQMELTQARAKADAEAQGTASGAQARVADLETRLAQALAAKEGSAQRADQLAADLQKASRESAEAQTRVQTLSVELAAARRTAEAAPTPAEVAKWEAERATMNQELVTLRGRLELAEADRKEARRSLEELSQSMADRLGRAEGNANALATHVHELEGDLGRLRQEQQSGGTDRIATLERENAALRTENEKLRSMLTPQQKSKACIIL